MQTTGEYRYNTVKKISCTLFFIIVLSCLFFYRRLFIEQSANQYRDLLLKIEKKDTRFLFLFSPAETNFHVYMLNHELRMKFESKFAKILILCSPKLSSLCHRTSGQNLVDFMEKYVSKLIL